jgi:hypothetical protein
MSTEYNFIKPPVTKLEISKTGNELKIWVDGEFAGELKLGDSLPEFLKLLQSTDTAARTVAISAEQMGLHLLHAHFDMSAQVISEYGKLTTLGELKEEIDKHGRKRNESNQV